MTGLRLLLLCCALLGPGCAAGTLVAQRLVLVDSAGTPRAFLGVTDEGTGLVLYDARGTVRAGLNLFGDDVELSLSDRGGRLRVVLETTAAGSELLLRDGEGNVRLRAAAGPEPRVDLLDTTGAPAEQRR